MYSFSVVLFFPKDAIQKPDSLTKPVLPPIMVAVSGSVPYI